jgi:cation transport ATPase
VCGALSLAGLLAWVITQHGTIALVVSIGADAIAATPTIKKSWTNPETETAASYVTLMINAGITLFTIKKITTAEFAFPVYIFVLASLQTALVAGRPWLRERRARATRHPVR